MHSIQAVLRATFVFALTIVVLQFFSGQADAATIKEAPVCKKGGDICLLFGYSGAIPVVKSFTFNAPRAGTALVSFHGSMQCLNNSATAGDTGVIDLTAQIVNDATPPSYQEPGGLRITMRLPPGGTVDYSLPVNLGSSRVIALTAGAHTFSFKIVRNRMDFNTDCTVYNGNFTVVFVP
jgi:hypothetical protein